MLVIISTKLIHTQPEIYSNVLIYLGAFMIIYDVIFLAFHTASSQIEGFYVGLLVIINLIGFVIKLIIVVSAIVIKVDSSKSAEGQINLQNNNKSGEMNVKIINN